MNRLSVWDNNINYAHPCRVPEQRVGCPTSIYEPQIIFLFSKLVHVCVRPCWSEPEAFLENHLDALAVLVSFARQTDFLQLMELVSVSFSIAGRENRTSRRLPWLRPHQTGSRGFPGSPKKEEANRLGVCCLLFFFFFWCWYPAVSLSHSAFHTLNVPSFLDMLLCVNSCVFTRAF